MTDLECKETVYITPEEGLIPVRTYFDGPIPLDPATETNNPTKALHYCTEPGAEPINGGQGGSWVRTDGLSTPWSNFDGVFVNPPYGKVLKHWCEKIYEETNLGASIIALLPCGARFATHYFQNFVFNSGLEIACFVNGRMSFIRPSGASTTGQNPYDSVYYGFNVDADRFEDAFVKATRPVGRSKTKTKRFGRVVHLRVA